MKGGVIMKAFIIAFIKSILIITMLTYGSIFIGILSPIAYLINLCKSTSIITPFDLINPFVDLLIIGPLFSMFSLLIYFAKFNKDM